MNDLKLPVALVIAMAVQLVAAVWWVSKQAHTIDLLPRRYRYKNLHKRYGFRLRGTNRLCYIYRE